MSVNCLNNGCGNRGALQHDWSPHLARTITYLPAEMQCFLQNSWNLGDFAALSERSIVWQCRAQFVRFNMYTTRASSFCTSEEFLPVWSRSFVTDVDQWIVIRFRSGSRRHRRKARWVIELFPFIDIMFQHKQRVPGVRNVFFRALRARFFKKRFFLLPKFYSENLLRAGIPCAEARAATQTERSIANALTPNLLPEVQIQYKITPLDYWSNCSYQLIWKVDLVNSSWK